MARPFGNVRTLPSGRYRARYTGPDGKERSGPHTYKTVAEGRLWLAEQEVKLRRGNWIDPKAAEVRFADYIDRWWETKAHVAPTTRAFYESTLRNHLMPTFKSKRLNQLTQGDIRRWLAGVQADTSPRTAAAAYKLMHDILATAVEDEILSRNPCMVPGGVNLPGFHAGSVV